MPEDPNANRELPDAKTGPPAPADPPEAAPPEDDIGDFINRHVFEKDSVFNEG